ncbi:acyl-CoA--6-aminopenicillanic acid acyl-transferase [Treponema sp. OMZ 792]|uniref:C45 family autoproteolytic acyltransferase/hydolase n=1 Tax=unclassified Treponema TaxID=2638727 RepID=UPI0020A5E3E9|nr:MULTISPECIES: C45 family peptidase [unclassified Treponema]UTC75988.1 acyl-CoA--6-aminopenicillanic acid acyl-transferase [Treponema sp. OMZ 792]UTC79989.1 acyl-CoA--6-aminopenicillanic acid acyl-transferase [Treponema sp. OMZ 798]
MYHPRFKGNHYAMGQKLGSILKQSNVSFPINLDSFQKKFGKESGIILNDMFPEIVAEIKGITDQIGIDNAIFTSWLMCMGCCLDVYENESTEIRGCTAFTFIHDEKVYYARNNDLPPFLEPISKSIYYRPENGNSFILNTSSFVNGEEGINEYGLVAAMTFVKPIIEEIKPGINSVLIVRLVLEKCKTVIEAVKFIEELPIASSCNILLADKLGDMVVLECHPKKINKRMPTISSINGKYIVTVNHFTSKSMWKYDESNRDIFMSDARFKTVKLAFDAYKITDAVQYAKDILMGKYGFMCQYPDDGNFTTIWASLMNISDGNILRAEEHPLKRKFVPDKRLKMDLH